MRPCQQVCQIQMTNELQYEGICSIKDVSIDTIHMLTKSPERDLETSFDNSDDSDESDDSPIHDDTLILKF